MVLYIVGNGLGIRKNQTAVLAFHDGGCNPYFVAWIFTLRCIQPSSQNFMRGGRGVTKVTLLNVMERITNLLAHEQPEDFLDLMAQI